MGYRVFASDASIYILDELAVEKMQRDILRADS